MLLRLDGAQMLLARHSHPNLRFSLAFTVLCILLATLWFVGGASRADALGQVAVRGVACGALAFAALWAPNPHWRSARMPLLLLFAALALVLLQLVPLPPDMWRGLPGREMLAQPSEILGEAQPWRPLAMVPDAAVNAAFSLVVPLAVLILALSLRESERRWLPGILLLMIILSGLVGLLQISGAALDLPFINDTPGSVSGTFANRNHFALFLAIGCLVAPVWASPGDGQMRWKQLVAMGLILVFVLLILVSGSRSGMLVGAVGVLLGVLLVRKGVRNEFRRAPRWAFPAVVLGIGAAVAISVLMSVAFGRAVSIQRLFLLDTAQDVRAKALPTVLSMIETYFPAGSGFGGFDSVFRMHEPFELLKPTYYNHAHNEYLEIALDGGLAGILLLAIAVLWWLIASVRTWRSGSVHAQLGSAILFLVLMASLSDYPARTPVMMAVVVFAAVWLSQGRNSLEQVTLPAKG